MDTNLSPPSEIQQMKSGTQISVPTRAYYSNRKKIFAGDDLWRIYGTHLDIILAQRTLEDIYDNVERIPRKKWDGFSSGLMNWFTNWHKWPKRPGLNWQKLTVYFGGHKTEISSQSYPEEIFTANEVRFRCEPHIPSHQYFEAEGPEISAILEYLKK